MSCPGPAGLSHLGEKIFKESVVASGAFDFARTEAFSRVERTMVRAMRRRTARLSGALPFLARERSSSKTTSSPKSSLFSIPNAREWRCAQGELCENAPDSGGGAEVDAPASQQDGDLHFES